MLRAYSSGDPCLHDPCVIAHLLDPGIFSGVEGYVEVEYAPSASYGMSVASVLPKHLQGRATNCLIMTDLQQERMFLQLKRGLTNLQTAVNEAA
jgi:purine nucleosidase